MTNSPAMSAAARGRETPDAGAFLGKEGGINPSLALHSNHPGEPQRAWPGAGQCRGTAGWIRHLPWLQPGTQERPSTLQDPSVVRPPQQHGKPGVPTAGTCSGLPAGFVLLPHQHPRAAVAALPLRPHPAPPTLTRLTVSLCPEHHGARALCSLAGRARAAGADTCSAEPPR